MKKAGDNLGNVNILSSYITFCLFYMQQNWFKSQIKLVIKSILGCFFFSFFLLFIYSFVFCLFYCFWWGRAGRGRAGRGRAGRGKRNHKVTNQREIYYSKLTNQIQVLHAQLFTKFNKYLIQLPFFLSVFLSFLQK